MTTMMRNPAVKAAPRWPWGPRTAVMAVRCARLYAAMLGMGVVLAAIGGGVRYGTMTGRYLKVPYLGDTMLGAGAADVESLIGAVLFGAGVIWFLAFVGPELCHGVNRHPLAIVPAVCGVAAAAVSAIAMTALEYALAYHTWGIPSSSAEAGVASYGWWGNDLYQMPFSYRFLYAWQYIPSTGGANKVSGIIPGGWLCMGVACFALMLAAAASGMLAGAAAAWACAGGTARLAACVGAALVAYLAAMRLFLSNSSVKLAWLAMAMTGEVIRFEANWSEWHRYVAWIPLVESLALFAVCVAASTALTVRREVHASRRWLI